MNIEIISGVAADSLLGNEAFRAQWAELCNECPWSTAYQTAAFVFTWYRNYRGRFEPVLVVSHGEDGRLAAALPLCETAGRLVVAGSWQAEYQTWICREDLGNTFPIVALQAVRCAYPREAIEFHYLPRNTPIAWIAESPLNSMCVLKPIRRPLVQIGDGADIEETFRKTGNKSRIRRMKKLGPIEFKHITDPIETAAMIDEVIGYYDARRMAINGSAPFENDAFKKPFHLALLEQPGLLHVTTLRIAGQITSFHLNMCGKKEVHLNLIGHNPMLAMYSPGKMHIMYLSRMLLGQGYEQLDLTPGSDAYKERTATAWDEVHTLTVAPTRAARTRALVRLSIEGRVKKTIESLRIKPAKVQVALQELRHVRFRSLPGTALRRGGAWAASTLERRIYSSDAPARPCASAGALVRRDSMADLLRYQAAPGLPSRQAFVSMALKYIEAGRRFYTQLEQGRLAHFGWMMERPNATLAAQMLPGLSPSPVKAILMDFRLLVPEGSGERFAACVNAMLQDLNGMESDGNVFIIVPSDNPAVRHMIDSAGFHLEGSVCESIRLGRHRRWVLVGGERIELATPHQELDPREARSGMGAVESQNDSGTDM